MSQKTKKNVYFVQVGFAFDNSLYLPYAVGVIAAYAWQDSWVSDNYELKDMFFKREKLNDVLNRLDNPYIVAFSNYVWNYEYNKALAKQIRSKYPNCYIVFGGHNVAADNNLLNTQDYIDILIHGEGEESFLKLLKALPLLELDKVPNIAYKNKKNEIIQTQKSYSVSLKNHPSPYLTGIFDKILKENPDIDFLAVLETNRGCPYNCSYCDWCDRGKIRFFSIEKIRAEIQWLSYNKIEYCFCADANFGMFERDLEIVNDLTQAKKATGFPKVFRPCYDKNSDELVFEICKKLNAYNMDKGATMAYQTLCTEALVNINRENLTLEHFSKLLKMYNENGIPTYSEMILGLPGETYDSFCDGLCKLLEAGQHRSISVYYCEMLVNSEMAKKEYIEKHQIESVKVKFNHIHSIVREEEIQEYSYLVISTATMKRKDWIRSNMFSICVQCFHNLGLLRCFAIYLYYEKGISYLDFYKSLLERILRTENTLTYKVFKEFESRLSNSLSGNWNYQNDIFGKATFFFEEGAFLEFLYNYDTFWNEILPFLKEFEIEENIFSELLKFQKSILKYPGIKKINVQFNYNFADYFKNIYSGSQSPLEATHQELILDSSEDFETWQDYAREIVWYGRRRGATYYSIVK